MPYRVVIPLYMLTMLLVFPSRRSDASTGRTEKPVLEFPGPGIDDTSAYRGYLTRFFRDSGGSTVQVVLDDNSGRVVNLWADAVDESIGFTVRDTAGHPAHLGWRSAGAEVTRRGNLRFMEYSVMVRPASVDIGLFLLGSMRVERDFQYAAIRSVPLDSTPYQITEIQDLLTRIRLLPDRERRRELSLLGAPDIGTLSSRLIPTVTASTAGRRWIITVTQPAFDGKSRLWLRFSGDTSRSNVRVAGNIVEVRPAGSGPASITVRIGTDSPSLTPLGRGRIFNRRFLRYYDSVRAGGGRAQRPAVQGGASPSPGGSPPAWVRMERQVLSVDLLASREKLMAGLPNYATYFGRDMMMSAMMMESILRPDVEEDVIDCVLKKLSPLGEVSHEEALGGQAIRENAGEYDRMIDRYLRRGSNRDSPAGDSLLSQAGSILANLRHVRENYGMVDETFQLPVLVGRYLASPALTAGRKKNFILGGIGGGTRLSLIVKNLERVCQLSAGFGLCRDSMSLVSFHRLDDNRWRSGSWRDSGPGYANGRFAMDVNAVWVPAALEAARSILGALSAFGVSSSRTGLKSARAAGTPLDSLMRKPAALDDVIMKWRDADRFFTVHIGPDETHRRVESYLSWLPGAAGTYWSGVLESTRAWEGGITFLALALDSLGRPIPVVNTDPATWLFLENFSGAGGRTDREADEVRSVLRTFVTPYPVGLFVPGVGPVIANDAYADRAVWEGFVDDEYHSPRVVWGREVNLFLLGVCRLIHDAGRGEGRTKLLSLAPLASELREALEKVHAAVEASGLKESELWSYEVAGGRILPARYPASCDIQLWNLTDLAVEYELDRLGK